MSEARQTHPEWAYALEKAVFHGLFFALCGPVMAFLGYLLISEALSIPQHGFAYALKQATNALQLLGSVYLFIAYGVIAPLMFMSGAAVALMSSYIRNEHVLAVLGFAATVAMALVFSRFTGVQEGSRLPLPWTDSVSVFVSGLTGSLMVWSTRFLRRWSERSVAARSELLP